MTGRTGKAHSNGRGNVPEYARADALAEVAREFDGLRRTLDTLLPAARFAPHASPRPPSACRTASPVASSRRSVVRCGVTAHLSRMVASLPGVEVRTHGTTLYNSLFRFDQDLLVNAHAYGALAGESPLMHLRHVPGGRIWDHYMRSSDEVWSHGTPEPAVPSPRSAG